jgi:hypothetical protein
VTEAKRKHRSRFAINPGPLKIVPAAYRKAWENLAKEVDIDVPKGFRAKWTRADTARVILADPSESYDDLAQELGRTPGAIRYRRQAMVHLLRGEHGAPERVADYRADPRKHHKHHDYHQVDELLHELGIFDMPVSQQFAIAQPLQQPRGGWRGDGTGAALADGDDLRELRKEIKRLSKARAESRSPKARARRRSA